MLSLYSHRWEAGQRPRAQRSDTFQKFICTSEQVLKRFQEHFSSMKTASFGEHSINSADQTVFAAGRPQPSQTGHLKVALDFSFFLESLSPNPASPQLGKVNTQGLNYKYFNGRGIDLGPLSFIPLQTKIKKFPRAQENPDDLTIHPAH